MIDLRDVNYCPTLGDVGEYVENPLFGTFCAQIKMKYNCRERLDFSTCSWEYGWNIKFKKSGKTLCTIYPRKLYFTVLIVVGKKEKEQIQSILPDCTQRLREIYSRTKEGNGQRWLMIDLEEDDDVYKDVLQLIDIRGRR